MTKKNENGTKAKDATDDSIEREELVGNINPNQRNWRGIGIALFVILIVCSIIITAVILVTPNEEDDSLGEKFKLDDIFSGDFEPHHFSAHWRKEKEEFIFKNDEKTILLYKAIENDTYKILDNSTFIELEADQYKVSHDLNFTLIPYNVQPVYRYSTVAQYRIKKGLTKTKIELDGGKHLQYVGWGPTGNSLVFVKDNNIYYKKSLSDASIQLTTDGVRNEVFNGIPDWVYEEEIIGSDHTLWWSNKGTYLCYAVFNDTQVPKYHYPVYGQPEDAYGHINQISYPKPGYRNPTVKLKVVNLETNTTVNLTPPDEFKNIDHLFTAVSWKDDEYISIIWCRRIQNHSIILICKASDGTCQKSTEEKGHGGWVDLTVPPKFNEDGSKYFMVLSQKFDSRSGYYKHVAMISHKFDGKEDEKTFITMGKIEVESIVGHSESKKLIYYLSNGGNVTRRHLYSVGYDESSKTFKKSTCLSCDVSNTCQYVTASFSQSARFYILGCLGPGVPYYVMIDTDDTNADVKYTMLEENKKLKEALSTKAMPKKDILHSNSQQ